MQREQSTPKLISAFSTLAGKAISSCCRMLWSPAPEHSRTVVKPGTENLKVFF